MSSQWITHKGRTVLYLDYRGLKGEDFCNEIGRDAGKMLESKEKVLNLCNLTDAVFSGDVMAVVKDVAVTAVKPTIKKAAFVGITGIKTVFLLTLKTVSGQGDKISSFNTEQEALDWLVAD